MSDYDADRDAVIKRALDQGIENNYYYWHRQERVRAGTRPCTRLSCIYAALGLHPHNAKTDDARIFDFIKESVRNDKVVALGEMGLDFFKNWSPQQDQIRCFHEQLAMARELKLPVIIHDRDAHAETVRILKEEQAGEVGGVIHCFSGDYQMAADCMDMGFYISIPGTITFKNATVLHDVVKKLPLDRILIETDAPFLTPHPFRGKRNEPAYVRYVAEKIAEIKELPLAEVARATTQNAKTLFSLP